ncbi:MAG: caspase family protein [Caldilineaceae bacterium]
MSTQPQFYALFVGIDNYRSPNVTDLRGCVNDVSAMAGFVRAKLNLPEANIRLYTASEREDEAPDRLATRANILAGFEWLLDQAKAKDQVFIHYSGHGSQAPTVDPKNEADGLDETLVPCDSRMAGPDGRQVYDILDKEIKTYIDLIEASGAIVTVFFDCCHSGSGTRDPKVLARRTSEDVRTRGLDSLEPRTAARLASQSTPTPQRATASGWLMDDKHVLLAGCRDEELSHEYRDPESGAWHGATTFFLLRALGSADEKTTWGQVYDQVRTQVNGQYQNQMPQLEGPENRTVFGELSLPADPYLLVEQVESDNSGTFVYINGGPPVGLNVGSRIELYPPGSVDLSGPRLAQGIVNELDRDSVGYVWAKVTTPPADGVVPRLSRVKIAAQSYDGLLYPVAADDPLMRAALTAVNSAGEQESVTPFLKLMEAGDDAGALFRVEVQDGKYVIQDAAGVQIVVETPAQGEAGAQQVAKFLEHLAVYNNVRNLRNPSPDPKLAEAVKISASNYNPRLAGRNGRPDPNDAFPLPARNAVLEPKRAIYLSIENQSGEDLYVSVYGLDPNFGIEKVFPRRGSNQKVTRNYPITIERLQPGVDNPFLNSALFVLKVFVSREPLDLSVLEMSALNQPVQKVPTRSTGPLARLLNAVRSTGTRSTWYQDEDPNDLWLSHQIEITILAENAAQELPAGETAVEIGSPLEMVLTKPADFSGQLVASSVTQMTRGADVDAALPPPPGLSSGDAGETFVPLTFSSGTRSAIGSPGVLALNAAPDELAKISEENPLRLELTLDEEEDLQGVMPVAYDGEYYFLAGQIDEATTGARDPNRRRVALSITHLPLPADADTGGGTHTAGDAPTRDLKRTARLFFYKVYRKELPADTGVRRPLLEGNQPVNGTDGKPAYTGVTTGDVAAASRVALLVHGFTSDTGWLVQRAWPHLGKLADYDLVLTYDYETFNTGMGENGALLAQELVALGFGPDDGVHLDIFSHSMGTQVARALVELEGGHSYVNRVFLAGAPNAGTKLAEAKKLITWLGTILLNQAGIAPPTLIANWFLKKFLDSAVSVGDLMPGSELYKKLNSASEPLGVEYFVLIGTNKSLDGRVDWDTLFTKSGLSKVFGKGLDALLGPNDLLVGVASAKAVRNGQWPGLQVAELAGNHFQYFDSSESVAQLEVWMATAGG